jgi:son of sevenless-like protein
MTETLKPMEEVIAVHEFRSPKNNLLDISQGDMVYVMGKNENGWWDGVIFGELGPIRGWFPSSYCKSRSQLANESQSGRPQTMTSLLRQNLDRPRKNSSVSFTSDHSAMDQESIKPSRSSLDPTATEISVDRIQLVTAQEAESIFNSTGSSNVPIWIPQATTEGTIIYYNSEMNIYCKELPYIETPEVDEASVVQIPTNDQDPTLLSVVNLHKAHIDTGFFRNRQSLPNTASSASDRKSSGKGSIVSKTSERSTTTVHPWNTSLYCVPDLFYYDPADITTWSSLRDGFLYFLQLTLDSLQKKAGPSFYSYFNIASRLGVLINLSARLAQHDLQKSGYQKRVHRRLKKIASSIAQVGINGSLYLNDDGADRNFSTSTQDTVTPDDSVDPKTSEAPSNAINYLEQVEIEVENLRKSATTCIKVFMQISSNNFNDQAYLPQVYPRFLTGFFSGGNWRNPFVPEPKDPFAGKEVVKSLHQKRLQKTILSKETYETLEVKKQELVEILEDVLTMLKAQKNDQPRNVQILSKVHRSLTISSKIIDMFEGLDFSIFLNTRRDSLSGDFDASKMVYPLLSEFFASKQELRDIFVTIIMESQNLTLDDATLFRSIREDKMDIQNKHIHVEPHRTAIQLEAELQKLDVECDDGISIDMDKNLEIAILSSFEALEVSLALVAQLISERDAYLNYATRLLNDDLVYDLIPTEREDSTMTDEYALPASATGRHQKRDIPWYLESEEFNLIFSNNDTVKGGTRDALVQRLTHHDLLDASFNMTFLTTFRSMMTTTTLVEMLIKRFNTEPPENLSYEEYTDWLEKKSYPIKLRVVNIMKSLLNKYWTPAYLEPKLSSIWGSFIDELVAENFPGSEQLSRNFKKNLLNEGAGSPEKPELGKEKSFSSKIKKMKLLDIDSTEFANQLTIKEARLYSLITHIECLDKAWNNKYGSLGGYQHLQEFIYNSNDLTNFVSTTIVKQGDIKKRVSVIKYFVDVAEKCRHLNNFSSMTAIISALYSSPVHRLNKTWKLVPSQTMSTMNKLNDLMNSSRNFSEYREHLRFIGDHPCVPFLGVFLSDLTFTTNGNSDHLHGDSTLVNFSKRAKTLDILREMSKYQSLKYNLKVNDDIQLLIAFRLSDVQSIDEQYNHSLIIEPRVRVSKTVSHEHSHPKTKITKYSIVPFAGYGP